MKAKTTRMAVLLLNIIFASAAHSAFGQGWPQLPCQALNWANVVFIGRVAGLSPDTNDKESNQYLIDFIVQESFVDTSVGEKLTAHISGGTADYIGIAVGKSFLVYGERVIDPPYLNVNAASKAVKKAAADLVNLRTPVKDSSARIFGSIRMFSKSSVYKDSEHPMPGIKVSIFFNTNEASFETVTDRNGNFEVAGLRPGLYSVRAQLQQNKNLIASEYFCRLVRQGCSQANVDIRFKTQVSGKIVDVKGEPVAKAQLELIPVEFQKPRYNVEGTNERAESNDFGEFSITNVPPGKYHLAVNYTYVPEKASPYPTSFFPGTPIRAKAEVIVVTEDKNVEGLRYLLGPERLTEKKVTGRVVYADGRPLVNTDVYLKEDENKVYFWRKRAVTDAKGNFTLIGFATYKYRIWTIVNHKPFTSNINYIGASPVFVLDSSTPAFQLVMKPTSKTNLAALDEIELRERGKIR